MGSTRSGGTTRSVNGSRGNTLPPLAPLKVLLQGGSGSPAQGGPPPARYAPLNPEGPLPPAITTALVRLVYKHTGVWPSRVLQAAGISSPQDSDEQFRKHLDDPAFRKKLTLLKVTNFRRKAVTACFHEQLYCYLRDVRSARRGIYEEVIKRSLEYRNSGGWFLLPERFRDAVATIRRKQGTATIQPESPEELLALFVVAFGLLQPEEAERFVQVLLPLGSGFAEFFGVKPSPVEPPGVEPSPAPSPPVAALSSALRAAPAPTAAPANEPPAPSVPAPTPAAVTAKSVEPRADVSPPPAEVPASQPMAPPAPVPSAATSPSPVPASPAPEPEARAPATPPAEPETPGMSTTDGDPVENEHWQVIDACASQLLESYEKLRMYSEQSTELMAQLRRQLDAMDQAGMEDTHKRIQSLIPIRRSAENQVATACDGLEQQILRLSTTLEAESTEGVGVLLSQLRDLTAQARSSSDAGIAQQLKARAAEVRSHLRDVRALALNAQEQQIDQACERLKKFGEPTAETRAFLEAKPYLDWSLERARLRLKNELAELESRIAACSREWARLALDGLEQRLAAAQGHSEEELRELTRIFEQAARTEENGSRLAELGPRLLDRVSAAPLHFDAALSLWRRAVACFWGEGTAANRLASVIAFLPRPPPSMDTGELAREAGYLLIDAGHEAEDAEELWPVLEVLFTKDQPAWAQAFFVALWTDTPPRQALARWWLWTQGRGVSEDQLEEVSEGLPAVEAYAVRCWAVKCSQGRIRPGLHPLLVPWLARHEPFASLRRAQEAIELTGASREPASSALLAAIAVLSGQQAYLFQDHLEHLRTDGFHFLVSHLEVFALCSREEIAQQLERHAQQLQARKHLELGEHRNPGGGPAFDAWRRIVPKLSALRARLEQPAQREAALAELEAIKPRSWLKQALKEAQIPGLNPTAMDRIPQWIEDHLRYLPAATGPGADLPEGFLSPPGQALHDELETLKRSGGLGELAAEYLARLFEAPTRLQAPQEGAGFQEEARELFRVALSRPLLRWRFQLATEQEWLVSAGEDVLEELAGLSEPRTVAARYLSRRRLELAEALRDTLGEREREAVGAQVQAELERARDDMKAEVQSLMLEPIEQALGAGAHDDVALGQELVGLRQEATRLLEQLPGMTYAQAQQENQRLGNKTDVLLHQWERFDQDRRQQVYDQLQRALSGILHRRPVEGGPLLAQSFAAALEGNLSEARRYLSLLSLPPEHPSRATAALHPASMSYGSSRPPRIRPVVAVDIGALSRFTRQTWDRTQMPPGFTLLAPHAAGLITLHEQQLNLLHSAKKLYTEHQRWRPFLARWALEEGFAQARERGFSRASEYARDATLLLTGEPDLEEARWYLDEALTLLLAARLEGSDLARAREPLPWDELRNHLRIAFLVRRFVEYRGLDVLAEIAIEVAALGGLALSRLLCTIGENEHHLRGLLIREVIRNGTELDAPRVAVIVDLLLPWLDLDAAGRLEKQLSLWQGGATQGALEQWLRELARLMGEAGVPSDLRTRVEESFQQRMLSRRAQSSDTRFSSNLATTLVYLSSAKESDEGIQLVANVAYREGLGNALDLKLAATVEHPTLTLESANKIQEVGLLRAGDMKDIVFPLVTAPGSERGGEAAKAQVTLLLYREDARGQTEQLSRRKFPVNVAANYPYQDESTPYITGKCVNERSMIKGRDKEVEEILGKLRHQHGENFVLIYGMRRIGKSSLLQRLSLDSRFRKHYEMVHLDLERHLKSSDTPATLLGKIADHIREELTLARARNVEPQLENAPDCYVAFEKYLRRIADALGDNKRLLLLFDEFQMLFMARETQPGFEDLVKTLRHWIQFLPVGFVVAGTPELKKATLGPEQRLFQLGLSVELKALDEQAARELIQEPVAKYFHVTGAATDLLLEETDRLPNLIQIICHNLFLRMRQRQQTVATQRDVLEVMEAVSRNDETFSFLLNPAGNEPLRRAVIRALAELGVDDKRGTVEELLEHLHSHGYSRTVTPEALEHCLEWLSAHHLTVNWRGEWRLRPALLARHVLQRQEYDL